MNITNYFFSIRFKEQRKKYNYTTIELGDILGVSNALISQYENGKKFPTIDMLWCICDLFNVSIDYIVGRSNEEGKRTDKSNMLGYRIHEHAKKTWSGTIESVGLSTKTNIKEAMINIKEEVLYREQQESKNNNTSSSEGDTTED